MNDFENNLINKIENKTLSVGIIGLGYVGLPLALAFSDQKIKVKGFDINEKLVNLLNNGQSHIKHIDSKKIKELSDNKIFQATSNFLHIKDVDVLIICVPTPLKENNKPDLECIQNVLKSLSKFIKKGQLICLESTTYPGATEEILKPFFESLNFNIGDDLFLIYAPEREDPGNKSFNTSKITKIIGADNLSSKKLGKKFYELISKKVVALSSTKAAELTKLLENVFRAVNIALVNEIKQFSNSIDIDIYEVINAAATKPFGFMPFYPGPGVGGHCIPIDPYYLSWKAGIHGSKLRLIDLAGEINSSMPSYTVRTLNNVLEINKKSLKDCKILVIGISYKKNIDDCRESPSIEIINMLIKKGALVSYNDPYFENLISTGRCNIDLKSEELTTNNLESKDVVILVTDHDIYDYEKIKKHSKLIIDTKGKFDNNDNIIRV